MMRRSADWRNSADGLRKMELKMVLCRLWSPNFRDQASPPLLPPSLGPSVFRCSPFEYDLAYTASARNETKAESKA